MMSHLARQRIPYMVERSELAAMNEPASRRFVLRGLVVVTVLQSVVEYLLLR